MALQKINCDNIGDLHHGFAKTVIDAAIEAAQRDTEDRGMDGKKRKVTIEISFEKVDDGAVKIGLEATARLPKYQIPDTVAQIQAPTRKGAPPVFAFRSDSPSRPDQPTLDDAREQE